MRCSTIQYKKSSSRHTPQVLSLISKQLTNLTSIKKVRNSNPKMPKVLIKSWILEPIDIFKHLTAMWTWSRIWDKKTSMSNAERLSKRRIWKKAMSYFRRALTSQKRPWNFLKNTTSSYSPPATYQALVKNSQIATLKTETALKYSSKINEIGTDMIKNINE